MMHLYHTHFLAFVIALYLPDRNFNYQIHSSLSLILSNIRLYIFTLL